MYYNGDRYTGTWKNGKRDGQGTYCWADGKKYTGYWTNGVGAYLCGTKAIKNYEPGITNTKATTTPQSKLDADANNFANEAEVERQKIE